MSFAVGRANCAAIIFVVCCSLASTAAGAVDPQIVAAIKAAGGNVFAIKEGGTGVNFQDWKPSDEGQKALESIADLKTISIGLAKTLDDAQFARLCDIKTLESISLNGYGGTEAALASLAKLPNLRRFGADHSPFTGTGLVALKNSPNFRSLRFGGCPFNDEGCKALGQLSQLKEADISHVMFTSAGFAHFAGLASLEKLVISPQFTPNYVGADFAALSQLKNLRTLIVSEMALPWEDGLDHLKGLSLERVELHDCRVSDADLAKLQAALPAATIVRDFSFDEKYKRWDMELERRKKAKP
jgi:hypothetical protein